MSGRIRSIKPELLEDEKAAALSDAAWRLFVSSWLLADDFGRFRAGPRYLAAQVWQDTSRANDAERALTELVAAGRVRVYRVGGDTYAEIPTWARHQRIDNRGKQRIPEPAVSDSGYIDAVSRRLAETRGGPSHDPDPPHESAALPPIWTSDMDLRPTTVSRASAATPTVVAAEVGAPARGIADLLALPADLLAVAAALAEQERAAGREGIGASVTAAAALGRPPTQGQRRSLAKIRDDWAARGAPLVPDADLEARRRRGPREPTQAELAALAAQHQGMSPSAPAGRATGQREPGIAPPRRPVARVELAEPVEPSPGPPPDAPAVCAGGVRLLRQAGAGPPTR